MNYNIENFIGVFDGYYDKSYCDTAINFYEQMEKEGFAEPRKHHEHNMERMYKDDSILYSHMHSGDYNTKHANIIHEPLMSIFWNEVYPIYSDRYDILQSFGHHNIYSNKIQKTKIGQGYHVWHAESCNRENTHRILVYTVYLNDVEEGGETEFLYIPKRVQPKAGRVLIFPAGFTHTHRGNPPISNTKYIMTGWIEF